MSEFSNLNISSDKEKAEGAELRKVLREGAASEATTTSTTTDEQPDKPKLPYFHRVLSAEDQALMDKIKPQRIDGTGENTASSSASTNGKIGGNTVVQVVSDNKLSSASAWNAAQSWEERDASKICREKLKALLLAPRTFSNYNEGGLETLLSCAGIVITGVTGDVEGSASVTHVRGM